MCGRMFSLLAVDRAQIRQKTRATPPVTGFPEGGKRLLVQFPGGSQVSLFARYIALLIDRPSGTARLTECLKDLRRLIQGSAGACIVAANLHHIGEVVKATRRCRPVGQEAPAREAPLKIALRRGVVPAISFRDCEGIQGRGYPPLIAQFLIKREAPLQKIPRGRKIP